MKLSGQVQKTFERFEVHEVANGYLVMPHIGRYEGQLLPLDDTWIFEDVEDMAEWFASRREGD